MYSFWNFNYDFFIFSAEMSEVLNEVVHDLKMSSSEVERLKMFVMSVMDSRGWGELSNSSIVGYPFYFEFKDPQEVFFT